MQAQHAYELPSILRTVGPYCKDGPRILYRDSNSGPSLLNCDKLIQDPGPVGLSEAWTVAHISAL